VPRIHKARSRSVDSSLAWSRWTAVSLIAKTDTGPLSISTEDGQRLHRLRRSAVDRTAVTGDLLERRLGNMRANGVRTLGVWCSGRGCGHHRVIDVERYGDDVPVPCSSRGCAASAAATLARTHGRTGVSWPRGDAWATIELDLAKALDL
jgi:hypothetical protein